MSSEKAVEIYSPKTTNPIAKDFTVFVGLVINGVLDIRILEDAARELVNQWPMLGGTLIQKTSPFSIQNGTTVDFKTRTVSSKLKSYFPIDVQPSNSEILYQTTPQGNRADECFHFDSLRPLNLLPKNLFTLRVTVLDDATLLGFRIPHHFCDGESVYDVVEAYTEIIAGRKIKTVIDPPDVNVPLSQLVEKESKSPLPAGLTIDGVPFLHPEEKLLTGIRPWAHYVGYAVGKMLGGKLGLAQKTEEKLIHLPVALVEQWRGKCQKELDVAASSTNEVPKLSNLDVITAWFLQTSMSQIPPDNAPLNLLYNFSYRFALPASPPSSCYLKNTYYELRIHFPSLTSFQTTSLASIAHTIRTSVLQSKQPSIVFSNLTFQEKHIADFVAPGGKDMRLKYLPVVSSWTTFAYNGMDFSKGLKGGMGSRTGSGGKEKGKVVFTLPKVALPLGISVAPLAIVVGDGEGGFWLRANLEERGWRGHWV